MRRLFLLGALVILGWCGLALLSGATASAAETPGATPAPESASLLGTGAVTDVLDEATSAVRSVSNRPFGIVSVQQGDEQSARSGAATASRAGRTHDDEATGTTADPVADETGGTNRSVLTLVSVPVRGLAHPDTSVPVDVAVSAVDRTLGDVADAPLGSVTGHLVGPLDDTVSRTAADLAVVRGVVPTRHAATAAPETGRAGIRFGDPAHTAAHVPDAVAPVSASADGTATELRAGPPAGGHHTPSAPVTGDAPAMPLGVAGGSAPGSGSGNAGASGAYLDFAGVRPSAASGPVWTVRHNDERVPLDDPDRPRVSPD